jgi:hypothetical protein
MIMPQCLSEGRLGKHLSRFGDEREWYCVALEALKNRETMRARAGRDGLGRHGVNALVAHRQAAGRRNCPHADFYWRISTIDLGG